MSNPISYHWVDQDTQLADLCRQWQRLPLLALDTEFIRTDTFYPRPALLQIGDGQACYLLDVLALRELVPLQTLMQSGPTKLVHACSEDLEMLHHWLGVLPSPLLDTQLAIGFALNEPSLSYQKAVALLLDEQVDKDETRSDWLQRPLTQAQLHYAALDVAFLLPLWEKLQPVLQQKGWLEAVQQEGQHLLDQARLPAETPESRFKQAWRLSPRQLAVLQALAEWREQQARKLDRPRSRVLRDELLFELAVQQPVSKNQLSRIKALGPGWVKRFADDVLMRIQQASALPESHLPDSLPSPNTPAYRRLKQQLQSALQQQAQQWQIPAEYLARRKWQDQWIQQKLQHQPMQLPDSCPAWRSRFLNELLAQLSVMEVSNG